MATPASRPAVAPLRGQQEKASKLKAPSSSFTRNQPASGISENQYCCIHPAYWCRRGTSSGSILPLPRAAAHAGTAPAGTRAAFFTA